MKRFGWVQAVPAATDLQCLGGVRKADSSLDGHGLQGADLTAAVATAGVASGVGDGTPGQSDQLSVQAGLVGFDGQDPASAAFGEVVGMVTLTMQRVDGDHGLAQVADLVQ